MRKMIPAGLLALAAAVAAGSASADYARPYTSIATASKAMEEGEFLPGDAFYEAADCAMWTKDETKRRNLLAFAAEHDKSKSANQKRALYRLAAGGDLAAYKRYLSLFPHDADAFRAGLSCLRAAGQQEDAARYEATLAILVANWPDEASVARTMDSVRGMRLQNITGISDLKGVMRVLAADSKWKPAATLDLLIEDHLRDNKPVEVFLPLFEARPTEIWSGWMLEQLARSSIPDAKAFAAIKARLEVCGADKKKTQDIVNTFGGRFNKGATAAEWKALCERARTGKIPEPKESRLSANWRAHKLTEEYGKSWDGGAKKFKGDAAAFMRRGNEFITKNPYWAFDGENARWLLHCYCELAGSSAEAAKVFDYKVFIDFVFARTFGFRDDMSRELMQTCAKNGKLAELRAEIRRAAEAQKGRAEQAAILFWGLKAGYYKDNRGCSLYSDASADQQKQLLTQPPAGERSYEYVLDYFKRFKDYDLKFLVEVPNSFVNPQNCWFLKQWRKDALAGEEKAYVDTFYAAMDLAARYYAAGARFSTQNGQWVQNPVEELLFKAVEKDPLGKDVPIYAAATVMTGRRDHESRNYTVAVSNLLANGRAELAYLLATRNIELGQRPALQRLRTEASAKMPGIYPVGEKDPAYPLYVAADALANHNPERAWMLLSANLKVFDLDPLRYQPQFALWALEKYRLVRGENDELRDKAWEHIEKLLAKESSLPAEVAAGLFLLRAEIAEDRLQYDVAHSGYQAIRNHAQYQKTAAGRQAMFRDVELMMTMGNADGAAQSAEQWIAQPDAAVRAQGHYVLAKIAFLRKDYDETRKQLEKVFAIDFTHAEARLLQGEWKLATNYEVDDTQVLLGDLADRQAIRPGQPLSISVQDRNLSVAGGGASVPVIVTTEPGKDRERVLLYPGTRDPSLFRGAVDSVLGVAKPGDSRLQLAGDDTVSYCVDPEFLKGRGLPVVPAKTLTVVDDAELRLGGDDGKEARNLKPGLPLTIRLVDRDRSRKQGPSEVEVAVVTTSGDRLRAAKLKETGTCTGVFTADIPTAIPPPRAFASDSAVGKGPEDVISAVRNRPWQSQQDGRKPKSVGVDMMESVYVSEAQVTMSAAASAARVRLWGTLFGNEIQLGTIPAERAEERMGIRAVSHESQARNRGDFLREVGQHSWKWELSPAWRVVHPDKQHNRSCRHIVRGLFYLDEDRTLRLRLKPLKQSKPEDRPLQNLTCSVYFDGTQVMNSGWGNDAGSRVFTVALDKGIHEIELYAQTQWVGQAFELCSEEADGSLASLPADWADCEKHPELKTRLNDKCAITRTADGFAAKFAEPMLLRRLRWEFVDFAGNGLTVSKLKVVDKNSRTVIPSEHDYTEALNNSVLEVAPGDTITVTYLDKVTVSGNERAVERRVRSTFHDASIEFLNEDVRENGAGNLVSSLERAYRIAPGDSVFVRVIDPDCNLTSGADSIDVEIATTSGDKTVVKATERVSQLPGGNEGVATADAGRFYAQIRTSLPPAAGKTLKPGVIALKPGQGLVAAVKDVDNTNPGVTVIRKAQLVAAQTSSCEMKLYNTWSERVEDKSREGAVRLSTIRRRSESAQATKVWRVNCVADRTAPGAPALITPEAELPVELYAPSLIRHAGSTVTVQIAPQSEIDAAKTSGGEVVWAKRTLSLRTPPSRTRMKKERSLSAEQRALPETLYGVIDFYSSAAEERAARADEGDSAHARPEPVNLRSGDTLVVRCVDESGKVLAEAKAKIGTTAFMALVDSTCEAENPSVHLGESFHVMVVDPDRDVTDEQDEVEVKVVSKGKKTRTLKLRETMGRSGVFTCSLTPVVPPSAAAAKPAAPGAAAQPAEPPALAEDEFPSLYGDELTFTYRDELTGADGKPGDRTVVGSVLPGSDGSVRAYSKRFRDADQAVLVQFRLAECLFEMAKDYRKLKDAEKSAAAIADGRRILEAALRDYPHTSHAAEGEFLLANLYEQLAEEERQARRQRQKDGEDLTNEPDKSDPLFREAVARFSAILSAWPEGDYAARSQYHKALCLERLGDFARAAEEYVKMTYVFPESPLVGDASVRLASYYYKQKRFDVAGKIYTSFRNRFPDHQQAPNALFMGGQCLVKQAETLADEPDEKKRRENNSRIGECYKDAVAAFISLVDNYKDLPNKELLAQGLYWAGDVSFRIRDYANAYIYLKRTTFEYPETKWARHARGMLQQESKAFEEVAE